MTLNLKPLLLCLFLFSVMPSGIAYAYLDPATGSMLLQMIIGGIAGALVMIKLYWTNLKIFLFGAKSKDLSPQDSSDNDEKG